MTLLQGNFSEILSQTLSLSNFAYFEKISSSLVHPINFRRVSQEIQGIHLAFAICLALKRKIKARHSQICLFETQEEVKHSFLSILDELKKIADFNPLISHLKSLERSQVFPQKHEYDIFLANTTSSSYDSLRMIQSDRDASQMIWFQSMNYLWLLLVSLQYSYGSQPFQDNVAWHKAVMKLRDELIAKLIIEGISNCPEEIRASINFQFFFKYIQSLLPPNPEIIGERIVNIVAEVISCVDTELYRYEQSKMYSTQGKNILQYLFYLIENIMTTMYQIPNQLISKLISAVRDLLKINLYELSSCQQISQNDARQFILDDRELAPLWLKDHCLRIAEIIQGCLTSVQKCQDQEIVKNKILDLLRLVAKNQILEEDDYPLATKISNKHKAQKNKIIEKVFNNLYYILEKNCLKLKQIPLDSKSSSNFYFEYSISATLSSIVPHHIIFALKQRKLLCFVLQEYIPTLLQKVALQLSDGRKNPISAIVEFMQKIWSSITDEPILKQLFEQNITCLLSKLVTSQYDQNFLSFKEQNEASSEFFAPCVKLIQKITKKSRKQIGTTGTHLDLVQTQLQHIFNSDLKTSHYFIHLALQLIRSMPSEEQRPYRAQICQQAVFIMENIRISTYKTQYLMLLETICDLVVEEGIQDLNSQFWYYFKKNRSVSLPAFISSLISELISLLKSQKSSYYVEAIIDIICKTYKRFTFIEVERLAQQLWGKKTTEKINLKEQNIQSLLRVYFQPVFFFIQNIQLSVLDNFEHYESRKKVFQLIGLLSLNSVKEVHKLYQKLITNKLNLKTQKGILYFFLDISGLLDADIKQDLKTAILQLFVEDLTNNLQVFDAFTDLTLRDNDCYFKLFKDFLNNFFCSWYQINPGVYYRCRHILHKIAQKLQLLPQLYDTTTHEDIINLYQTYQRMESFQIKIPILPEKIYAGTMGFTPKFYKKYIYQLYHSSCPDTIRNLYTNIFERKALQWTFQETNDKLHEEIVATSDKPEILLSLCDYFELSMTSIFFDYTKLVIMIAKQLFSQFTQRYSLSSVNICSFDDTDNQQEEINYVQQFFKSRSQRRLVVQLAQVQHNYDVITGQRVQQYQNFQSRFFEQVKCLFYTQSPKSMK